MCKIYGFTVILWSYPQFIVYFCKYILPALYGIIKLCTHFICNCANIVFKISTGSSLITSRISSFSPLGCFTTLHYCLTWPGTWEAAWPQLQPGHSKNEPNFSRQLTTCNNFRLLVLPCVAVTRCGVAGNAGNPGTRDWHQLNLSTKRNNFHNILRR